MRVMRARIMATDRVKRVARKAPFLPTSLPASINRIQDGLYLSVFGFTTRVLLFSSYLIEIPTTRNAPKGFFLKDRILSTFPNHC